MKKLRDVLVYATPWCPLGPLAGGVIASIPIVVFIFALLYLLKHH